MGQLSRDATRQSRQLCVMADKQVAAPATPQQLTYAAGGTSILVLSGRRVKWIGSDGDNDCEFPFQGFCCQWPSGVWIVLPNRF